MEKEAAAIVEALHYWRYLLLRRKFQWSQIRKVFYSCMTKVPDPKLKNDKIARWPIKLLQLIFNMKYRPGKENSVADTFSRIAAVNNPLSTFRELHENPCHSRMTRLAHFVRTRNLPFSHEQVKVVTDSRGSCQYFKPKFIKGEPGKLVQAILPFQKLNVDFKGPLPIYANGNSYLLTIIDEYTKFPFAFACQDMTTKTVIQSYNNLFSIFGMPDMVHTDRVNDFMSSDMKQYLHSKGVATSNTSRYNPSDNGQVEQLNGTLWKAIEVTLHSRKMKQSEWELVIPDAWHFIRSLFCMATNTTPYERGY